MSFPFKIRHQDPHPLAPYPWHPYGIWDVLGSSKAQNLCTGLVSGSSPCPSSTWLTPFFWRSAQR